MAIIASFTLTKADILRMSWVGLRSQPLALAISVGFFVVLPWASAAWAIVEVLLGTRHGSNMEILGLLVLPPVTVVAFSVIPLVAGRGSKVIGARITLEFTDADIHFNGRGIDSRIQWSALTKTFGSRHALLFSAGNQPLVVVPGRALAPEARAELRAMAAAKGLTIVGPWAKDP